MAGRVWLSARPVVIDMQEYAKRFYKSRAWQECRDGYARSKGGLCELCLSRGLYRAGKVVHHIRHLTPDNIGDPAVSLAWNNLMLLCQDCHAEVHRHNERRYIVRVDGKVEAV